MSNELTIHDEILYKGLRPWLEGNNGEDKYKVLLSGLKSVETNFIPYFNTEFQRHFNYKTKYYRELIEIESIKYLNNTLTLIQGSEDDRLRAYWLNDTLEKKLQNRLSDIGTLVYDHQYDISLINPKNASFKLDIDHKSNTFIIHFLKVNLVWIYLEIQEQFVNHLNSNHLIIDDLYSQYLLEKIPVTFPVQQIITIVTEAKDSEKPTVQTAPSDVVYQSFEYKEYATNSENLKNLYDNLKKNSFILGETTSPQFLAVFSGKEVTKPVVWIGNISELNYFIKLIHNVHKKVKDTKQRHWQVACKCFIDLNSTQFNPKRLKDQKKPKSTAHLLEDAMKHI